MNGIYSWRSNGFFLAERKWRLCLSCLITGLLFQGAVGFHEHLLSFCAELMRHTLGSSVTETVAVQPLVHVQHGVVDIPPFLGFSFSLLNQSYWWLRTIVSLIRWDWASDTAWPAFSRKQYEPYPVLDSTYGHDICDAVLQEYVSVQNWVQYLYCQHAPYFA